MNTFKHIKYLDPLPIELSGLERYTKTLDFQPTKDIQIFTKKLVKDFENGDIEGLISEPKPYTSFYIYSLIKENNFHNILQISIRGGLDTLYFHLGLEENTVSESMKHLTSIISEEYWKRIFEKNMKHINTP